MKNRAAWRPHIAAPWTGGGKCSLYPDRDMFAGAELSRYSRFFNENLYRASLLRQSNGDHHVRAQARSADGFTVADVVSQGGSGLCSRTTSDIESDGRERYMFLVNVQGKGEMTQFRRTAKCAPGVMSFFSTWDPMAGRRLDNCETIYFLIPREFVDSRISRAVQLCGTAVLASEGVRHLAAGAIVGLQRNAFSMSAEEFLDSARLVADLSLLACAEMPDLTSKLTPIRTANLARARGVIRRRHSDPDLSLKDIAEECGLSLHYLHEIFGQWGCSLRDYLIQERLRSAHRLLEVSDPATTTVTDICVASGFSSPSFFSTAFRRAYAISPRDLLFRRRIRHRD